MKDKDILLIENYYDRVLDLILDNDFKGATKIIHNEMPVYLYDLSIDILDNRNIDFSYNKIRKLIEVVHSLLSDYSNSVDNEEIKDTDNFKNMF